MEYKFVKPLKDEKLIEEFEKTTGYKFEMDFIKFIKNYNAGSPSKKEFDTIETSGHYFNNFSSFNKEDPDNIWSSLLVETELTNLVPFAEDVFGNLICFEKETGHVVFWDHELDVTEYICENFSQFLKCLY